ncbi:MAG: hypothetical protein HQK60_02000 [Deltaproteobacteria bacterium]|nr:hypothetical protein [Deltaproteobacteria bacterium]
MARNDKELQTHLFDHQNVDRRTLQRDLKVMVDMGLLVSEGATSRRVYRMTEPG